MEKLNTKEVSKKANEARWANRNKYLAFFKSRMSVKAFKKISDCKTRVLKEMYETINQ